MVCLNANLCFNVLHDEVNLQWTQLIWKWVLCRMSTFSDPYTGMRSVRFPPVYWFSPVPKHDVHRQVGAKTAVLYTSSVQFSIVLQLLQRDKEAAWQQYNLSRRKLDNLLICDTRLRFSSARSLVVCQQGQLGCNKCARETPYTLHVQMGARGSNL